MKTKPRPLTQIDALSEEQQQQLADWVTSLTLAKANELAKEHFGEDIPQTSLYRYRKRCVASEYVAKDEDSAQARAELIAAAASGKPKFGEATVNLLEKHAFELAHAPQDPDAMDALKDLFGLLNSNKAAAVRDRMAKVQEDKVQLRRDELDWKKSSSKSHSQPGAPQHAFQSSTQNSTPEADHLGPLASTPEEILARARKKFRRVQVASDIQPEHLNRPNSGPENSNPDNSSPTEVSSIFAENPSLPGKLPPSQAQTASAVSAAPLTAAQLSTNPLTHSSIDPAPASVASSLKGEPDPETSDVSSSESTNPSSLPSLPSVLELHKAHAIKRWRAHIHRVKPIPEPDGSWRDECPCGKPLPCPDHPDLYLRVKCYRPQQPAFRDALIEHGVPYYIPTAAEIDCTQEELDKSLNPFAYDPQMKEPPDPRLDPFAKGGPFNL